MKAPKILAVASAADLDFRYGCTPAWWQIWKGLYEAGADLIVTPYRGRAIESPWWRTAPNPLYREAETFAAARGFVARLKGDTLLRRAEESPADTMGDRLTREAIWRYVTPRWQRHLERILERERDVAAVLVFTVPMAHFRGIPMRGLERLRDLGARRAEAVFWAADPELFSPAQVKKETDVFFYGYGDKFRREWMQALVGEPSRSDTGIDFALGGGDFRGDLGNARLIGDVPFNVFSQAISRARINLNITRRPHATVHASSTCRPFELAAAGAAVVSNPQQGMERWFDVGPEVRVVSSAEEALATYRELLADPAAAEEMGRRARERVLDEHTYAHRARQILELVGVRTPVASRG